MQKTVMMFALAGALAVPAAAAAKPDKGEVKNASQQCRAERKASGEANFDAKYGPGKNAFGKCVSQTARAERREDRKIQENAAKACKAERALDQEAFAAKYGSGKNAKNALGKCVSQKSDDAEAAEEQADKAELRAQRACRDEREAGPAAFRAKYGTNANGRNAFGKCVAAAQRA